MLTSVEFKKEAEFAHVTKADLDIQLKAQLTQLGTRIKKDLHAEILQMVSKDGVLMKTFQEALTQAMETTALGNSTSASISSKSISAAQVARVDGTGSSKLHRRKTILPPKAAVAHRKTQLLRSRSQLPKSTECIQSEKTGQTPKAIKPALNTASSFMIEAASTSALSARVSFAADVPEEEENQVSMPAGSESDVPASPLVAGRASSREFQSTTFSFIEGCLLHRSFEYGMAVLVVLNVILIGIETQIQASSRDVGTNRTFAHLDTVFCIIFAVELALRIYVYRLQIWLSDYLLQSTAFDAIMVALQILDQVVAASNLNVHILSALRIFRIARIIRLVHLFDELSSLIAGMTKSVESILWTIFLLAIVMYMFSIAIMQILVTTGDMYSNSDLNQWFGTVDRAVRTMFEILLGGMDWCNVLQELTDEVSPFMGFVLGFYIVVSLFFLMNLVCGVFVDRVTKTVREDKDEWMASRLGEIFTIKDAYGEEIEVTWEDFAAKLATDPAVQAYFASIDVQPDPTNARGLFELIDVDGSGSLSAAEIVAGCLRLRGPAKALETALLSSDVAKVNQQTLASLKSLDKLGNELQNISKMLHKESVQEVPSP